MRYNEFEGIKGDGLPFWTQFYRDTPNPFRLEDSWDMIEGVYEHLETFKVELIKGFDLKFSRYEINGCSYQDFKDLLDEKLYTNGAMIDRVIGLMGGTLYDPYKDRIKTVGPKVESFSERVKTIGPKAESFSERIKTVGPKVEEMGESTESGTSARGEVGSLEDRSSEVDVPKDNAIDDKDTTRSKKDSITAIDETSEYDTVKSGYTRTEGEYTEKDGGFSREEEAHTESEIPYTREESGYTEEDTDYGFDRPYQIVNKFKEEGRTINEVFNSYFTDCFIYGEAWFSW